MQIRKSIPDKTKKNGVHYTPPELAAFLADVTLAASSPIIAPIRVLDPACGDGNLLVAIANALPNEIRQLVFLEGYETDAHELAKADRSLSKLGVGAVNLHNRDFLCEKGVNSLATSRGLFDQEPLRQYDLVIANPPYVRTQVMGANKAQSLARQFGLTGRVDLYHAFAIAMTSVLKPGGVVGLLTSNRFLTIKSGAALREMFSSNFEIEVIYDLGDTKLFEAAVLPVIVVARKGKVLTIPSSRFHRIYEHRSDADKPFESRDSILSAIREDKLVGIVKTPNGVFNIQRGKLASKSESWTLSNSETDDWMATVTSRQATVFGELAKVRVGIKSTADEVFVRENWESLPSDLQPESELLHPLLTHREAARWLPGRPSRRIIYPHVSTEGKRSAVELSKFPKAAAYFNRHHARLSSREYVVGGGRKWYEIWVPHNPDDWSKPKIAYPDISEHPRFFFDASGAIVQGDCYWITLREGIEPDWLLLMLAVANSTFVTKYYDLAFHNKLYSGRRRFMTQYVAKFPLPALAASQNIVHEVSSILRRGGVTYDAERTINRLVWESFGLSQEIPI